MRWDTTYVRKSVHIFLDLHNAYISIAHWLQDPKTDVAQYNLAGTRLTGGATRKEVHSY